jgi:hypothetical protein
MDSLIRSIGATGTADDAKRVSVLASSSARVLGIHKDDSESADLATCKNIAVSACDSAIRHGVVLQADWIVER